MANRVDKILQLLGAIQANSSHGYELTALLKNPGVPISIGKGNAYQILEVLERDGWLTVAEEREGNRPPKRVYSITQAGKEGFDTLLRERLAGHLSDDHADAVSLNFLNMVPAEEAALLLEKRLGELERRLDEVKTVPEEIRKEHPGIDYLYSHLEFERRWLAKLIDKIQMV
jgi:DNA-binding PadR family transcriptional regulator